MENRLNGEARLVWAYFYCFPVSFISFVFNLDDSNNCTQRGALSLTSMENHAYDFAVIGAGAAGMHLILKMLDAPFFERKRILILERDGKTDNDRTWCFWEKGASRWDQLTTHTWGKGLFINKDKTIGFDLAPYRYKMVRSVDFYAYFKKEIQKHKHVEWVVDHIEAVDGQKIKGVAGTYRASHIFDSRVPKEFEENKDRSHTLVQHFKGWYITTKSISFDPNIFTMMDYRVKWGDSTSFTYVLPISSRSALVEFTLFNDQILADGEYDQYLKAYISNYLKPGEYTIEEVEKGSIPMSSYSFHRHHQKYVTMIGTAGGWVRPSSGYSFKNADRYSSMIVDNLQKGARPEKGVATSRFRMYDAIFLKVLASRNDLGEEFFTKLYTKPNIQSVFRFLDEESTLREDMKVMISIHHPRFWKALFSMIFNHLKTKMPLWGH